MVDSEYIMQRFRSNEMAHLLLLSFVLFSFRFFCFQCLIQLSRLLLVKYDLVVPHLIFV